MVNPLFSFQNTPPNMYRTPGPRGKNGTTDGDARWPAGLIDYHGNDSDTFWQLSLNKLSANIANKKTQDVMEIGADNHWYSFDTHECVEKVKKMTAELKWTGWKDRIEDVYNIVEKMKCGNCGEYAAVAFTLLKRMKTARPLDFIGVGSKTEREGYTHNFVVIGISLSLLRQNGNPISLPKPKHWGPAAVVCDAYHNIVYPAIELNSRRQSDRFRHSLYRLE